MTTVLKNNETIVPKRVSILSIAIFVNTAEAPQPEAAINAKIIPVMRDLHFSL